MKSKDSKYAYPDKGSKHQERNKCFPVSTLRLCFYSLTWKNLIYCTIKRNSVSLFQTHCFKHSHDPNSDHLLSFLSKYFAKFMRMFHFSYKTRNAFEQCTCRNMACWLWMSSELGGWSSSGFLLLQTNEQVAQKWWLMRNDKRKQSAFTVWTY